MTQDQKNGLYVILAFFLIFLLCLAVLTIWLTWTDWVCDSKLMHCVVYTYNDAGQYVPVK